MIVQRTIQHCIKGRAKELIELYKPFSQVPGIKHRVMRPQTGPMNLIIVEWEWESHTAAEAFMKSAPWTPEQVSEWNKKRLELVEWSETNFYQVVE